MASIREKGKRREHKRKVRKGPKYRREEGMPGERPVIKSCLRSGAQREKRRGMEGGWFRICPPLLAAGVLGAGTNGYRVRVGRGRFKFLKVGGGLLRN